MDWMPADLFTGLPRCDDGHLVIGDAPGHGLALVPGAEKKYRLLT
jgi:L-alanine-DL-glutamate epimerase-like enolase superfamily enzyme